MTCLVCQDGYPRIRRYDGKVFHSLPEPCPDLLCEDQDTATGAEKREELRNEIEASGDC